VLAVVRTPPSRVEFIALGVYTAFSLWGVIVGLPRYWRYVPSSAMKSTTEQGGLGKQYQRAVRRYEPAGLAANGVFVVTVWFAFLTYTSTQPVIVVIRDFLAGLTVLCFVVVMAVVLLNKPARLVPPGLRAESGVLSQDRMRPPGLGDD